MNGSLQRLLISRAEHAAASYRRQLWIISFFGFLIFTYDVVYGKSLRIMVMPIESAWTTSQEPFTKSQNPYGNYLKFENTGDWEKLGVGYHHWLCSELYEFAKDEKITVHIWFIPWGRALTDIEAHWSQYDIIQVPSTWTAHLIDQKVLHRLVSEPNLADYPGNLLKTCGLEEQEGLYAVPWQIDLRFLFFSKDLTVDPSKLTIFEQFRSCLAERQKSMKAAGFSTWKPLGLSLEQNWDILHDVFRYFSGGRILKKQDNKWQVAFMDEKAQEGLKSLWEISKQGLVYYDEYKSDWGQPGWRRMAEGLIKKRYDAVIGGLYMLSAFDKDPNVQVLVAPLPLLNTQQPCTYLGGSHLGITEAAVGRGQAPLAKKLIDRLTSYKTGVAMLEHTEAIPAHKKALEEFFARSDCLRALDMKALLGSAKPYPSIPQWARIVEEQIGLNELHKALQSIANGRDWEVVIAELETAAGRLDEELNRLPPPMLPPISWWKRAELWIYIALSLLIISLLATAILSWTKVVDAVNTVLDIVFPDRKKPQLLECDLYVDIGYEREQVTLLLTVNYGEDKWCFRNWRQEKEIPLLFELLLLRMLGDDDEKNGKESGPYLYSDDFPFLNYLVKKEISMPKNLKGTARKLFSEIRQDVFEALSSKCVIFDERGIKVNAGNLSKFMLKPVIVKEPVGKEVPLDETRTTEEDDERFEYDSNGNKQYSETASLSLKPAYEFILPLQVKSFDSNILQAHEDSRNQTLTAMFNRIHKYP